MFEKPPKMVGDKCFNKWSSLEPLNIKDLILKKLITLDDSLDIEEIEENKTTNFEGQIDDNKKYHGIGKWTTYQTIQRMRNLEIGTIYEGQFRRGEKTGYGRLIQMDGSWYEGFFINGVPHG